MLAIRGELLKQYPNAVIYAHRAEWQMEADGKIDLTRERTLVALDATPRRWRRRATRSRRRSTRRRSSRDIYLLRLRPDRREARGGTGDQPGDEGRPAGSSSSRSGPASRASGSTKAMGRSPRTPGPTSPGATRRPGAPPGAYLTPAQTVALVEPTDTTQAEFAARKEQWGEDKQVRWDPTTDAAEVAYVLYQSPVLVAVHAAEMLAKTGA